MGVKRVSFYNAAEYAKNLIVCGIDEEKACRLASHRFDEDFDGILKQVRRRKTILFYEGPVYLVNINDRKDIKKIKVAIKINPHNDMKESKTFIEKHYSSKPYRGLIKSSDWENARLFSSLPECEYFIKNNKKTGL